MTIHEIGETYLQIVNDLRAVDRIETAATFAGLMLLPELQANHLRLQALTHLSVFYGGSGEPPEPSFIQRVFEFMGRGPIGIMEDPSEDVFTALVHTGRGNFRLMEGIYQGAAFCLQRILNIMSEMPRNRAFSRLHRSVEALLRISDEVVARAGLKEYLLGGEFPQDKLSPQVLVCLPEIRSVVCFSREDLLQFGITKDDLADFALDPSALSAPWNDHVFHASLQRRPVVFDGVNVWLLFPSATAAAITRYIAEFAAATDQDEILESALVKEFARHFRECPLLGQGPNAPIYFEPIDSGAIAAFMGEVDRGRFLNLIFYVERSEGFLTTSYSGTHGLSDQAYHAIESGVENAAQAAVSSHDFKEGMSIVVLCGFGREIALPLPHAPQENWTIEAMPAFDFDTLCWIPQFDALSLMRLSYARSKIEREGVVLVNPSGLLNLVAWMRQLNGHLVPHASVPETFASDDGRRVIAIQQNAFRLLRYDVLTTFDSKRELDVDGRWVHVRRESRSLFKEERDAPLYFSEDALPVGRSRAVYVSKRRPYWIECICPEGVDRDAVFQHFRMAYTWIGRAAPVIDSVTAALKVEPIEFRMSFSEITIGWRPSHARASMIDVRSLIHIEIANSIVNIHIDSGFDEGLRQPDNVAEHALVEAVVAGATRQGNLGISQDQQVAIVNAICPGRDARSLHFFEARTYRDFIPRQGLGGPVLADEIDSALFRFGLGWKVRARKLGADIVGADECKAFLNAVVMIVLDQFMRQSEGLRPETANRASATQS